MPKITPIKTETISRLNEIRNPVKNLLVIKDSKVIIIMKIKKTDSFFFQHNY